LADRAEGVYDRPMYGRMGDVAAFVLAGGSSTRMGTDKAFVEFDGSTLLTIALGLAGSVASDVRVVGDRAKFARLAPVVEDTYRNCGPLAGIHAALRASDASLNLVLAVDMPLVTPELLAYLLERSQSSEALATVPRLGKGWQPLCAVYRRGFAEIAEQALKAGRYKIGDLFGETTICAVEEDELGRAGFSSSMFSNINTAQELIESRESKLRTEN
jgi:molybdopterin-guanine dinucleotide biosynthesis protein A